MKEKAISQYLFLATVLISAVAVEWGCNSAPTNQKPTITTSHSVSGIMVVDMNVDTTVIAVQVKRSGLALTTAQVVFSARTLNFDDSLLVAPDSVYSFLADSATFFPTANYALSISDSSFLSASFLVAVGDTFSIFNVTPASHILNGNQSASLEWLNSFNINGYIVAAVKSGFAYTGIGWSQFVTTGTSLSTIPPDAFLQANGLDPDTGLYNLYVYAYSGSPDSLFSVNLLPVPFPGQLTSSVLATDLSGRFGTVVVAPFDTVRVSLQ